MIKSLWISWKKTSCVCSSVSSGAFPGDVHAALLCCCRHFSPREELVKQRCCECFSAARSCWRLLENLPGNSELSNALHISPVDPTHGLKSGKSISDFPIHHHEDMVASSVWNFHLIVSGSASGGKPEFSPLKGNVHTFQLLAQRGGSDSGLKALCICFWLKHHKCEVHTCQSRDGQMVA